MKRFAHRLFVACLTAAMTVASVGTTAFSTEMEGEAAVAGMAVTLNNYYASTYTPEADILEYLMPTVAAPSTEAASGETQAQTTAAAVAANPTTAQNTESAAASADGTAASDGQESEEETTIDGRGLISEYSTVYATGVISVLGYLNVREDASTTAESLGQLYSNATVDIYGQTENDEGTWYLVAANGIVGYVNADYVRIGQGSDVVESNVTNKVAVIIEESVDAKNAATENGTVVATKKVDNNSVTQYTGYEVVWDLAEEGVAVSGDFTIEITNNSPSNSTKNKDRVAIWNVQWTNNPVA